MLSRKYIERIQNLKVGDFVTIYDAYGNNIDRMRLVTSTVEKIGRSYIWVDRTKFNKDQGHGEFSKSLFPGKREEFIEWFNNKYAAREVVSELNKYSDCLESEDIKTIKDIINRIKP